MVGWFGNNILQNIIILKEIILKKSEIKVNTSMTVFGDDHISTCRSYVHKRRISIGQIGQPRFPALDADEPTKI